MSRLATSSALYFAVVVALLTLLPLGSEDAFQWLSVTGIWLVISLAVVLIGLGGLMTVRHSATPGAQRIRGASLIVILLGLTGLGFSRPGVQMTPALFACVVIGLS